MGADQGLVVTAFNYLAHKENTMFENIDDGDCRTCPKNAKEGLIYPDNGTLPDPFKSYVYKDREWVTWFEAKAIMGTVDIGPASGGGKYLLKMMKNPNLIESPVKQLGTVLGILC
ncbi:MAG TPA: hypothetical protein DEB37_15375 [Lysinibacillus sp.]|nr:hypothetical protein [Lysinibacillus sp.]